MSERMSDSEFGVLYHVELPKWQEELGDPNLDKFADEARRARGAEIQGQIVGGMTVPEICDALRERDELRARVDELAESRAEIVDQRNKYRARVDELEAEVEKWRGLVQNGENGWDYAIDLQQMIEQAYRGNAIPHAEKDYHHYPMLSELRDNRRRCPDCEAQKGRKP